MYTKDHAYWIGFVSAWFLGIVTLYVIVSGILNGTLFSNISIYWAIAVLLVIIVPIVCLVAWRSKRWSARLVKFLACMFWGAISIYDRVNEVGGLPVNLVFIGLAIVYLCLFLGSFSQYDAVSI